jgi:hypothetical protein
MLLNSQKCISELCALICTTRNKLRAKERMKKKHKKDVIIEVRRDTEKRELPPFTYITRRLKTQRFHN